MFSWSDCVSLVVALYLALADSYVKITANNSVLLNK